MTVNWTTLTLTLIPLVVSYIVMTLWPSTSRSASRDVYSDIPKPEWAPPPIVFPIVWTTLYLLMGYALANFVRLDCCSSPVSIAAITVFVIQLGINVAWSPVFFGYGEYTIALWMIRALILLVGINMVLFDQVSSLSSWLLAPYLAWLLVAHRLNGYIVDAKSL